MCSGVRRGDFRIRLANNAVAAVALGGIKARVGAFDQRLLRVVLAQGGDPD